MRTEERRAGSYPRRDRRGAILLQVSFLLLALMGLLAMVIDLGMVRSTQLAMQTSADVAALEGLRGRDALSSSTLSDQQRRLGASRFAALVHDDDLQLPDSSGALILGAGPQFSTGVGGIDDPAGGLLVGDRPYLPALQANELDNAVHGDLVAGTYTALDPLDAGNPGWHLERSDYTRNDYVPAPAAGSPSSSAFLARLRRTRDVDGLDQQEGVSSSGPTIPFLFGLGSGVLSTDDPDVYDPRRDGITVRATSIADARPAVAVGIQVAGLGGVAQIGTDGTGAARILALEETSWASVIPVGGGFELTVSTDGSIEGVAGGPTPLASGHALAAVGVLRVGEVADAVAQPGAVNFSSALSQSPGLRHVALYSGVSGGSVTLTGFASVTLSTPPVVVELGGEQRLLLRGTKLPSRVATENASAIPGLAAEVSALVGATPGREPLLAPVMAR